MTRLTINRTAGLEFQFFSVAVLLLSKKGYKLLITVGRGGGQEVDHIHLHLLAYNV